MRRRARQSAAVGPSDGAVAQRSEGTPASPAARTFARTSNGGLGGSGRQWCSITRSLPGSRRGCPFPDPSGPPCSHARAPGPGTAGGDGSGRLHHPQAPIPEPALHGQPRRARGHGHHAGVLGFRVDCRSRRAVSGVRRASAVVAVPTPRHLAERPRPIGEQAPWFVRQRTSRALSGALRRRKVLLVRKLALAVHAAGLGRRRGASADAVAARPCFRGGSRSARGSSGVCPSGRERRSGGRAVGRSG